MKLWRTYETTFDAAHLIIGHPKCGQLHGHTYRVKVSVEGTLDTFIDFGLIQDMVNEKISDWDHKNLGAKTCEELVAELLRYLYNEWRNQVHKNFIVEIKETDKFGVFARTDEMV